jgi:hypothetical protein
MWLFLGCISRNYPVHPTAQQKKQYEDFMTSLGNVLPCKYCRDNYKKNCVVANMSPSVFECRRNFATFVNNLHNTVNDALGKSEANWQYDEFVKFFETFRAPCVKHDDEREGGCHGDRSVGDVRPTTMIEIVPEKVANIIKQQHRCTSTSLAKECI